MKIKLIFSFVFFISSVNATEIRKGVKFLNSKKINFESLLVEGERKIAEMSVVTGNLGEKDSGLIKMREDFVDMMADDFEENVE